MIDTAKIAEVVNRMHLPAGVGDTENACSIAAINLALTGELTDKIPDCMSDVIGQWIIVTQDAMPDGVRNSQEWKSSLPFAAGTGKEYETERLLIILDHMWTVALPLIQPIADVQGFGDAWRTMLQEKTEAAARAAEATARAARAAEAAAWAARATAEATAEATWAAEAAEAAEVAAEAAVWAARVARAARAAEAAAWRTIDPCGLLARLISVG